MTSKSKLELLVKNFSIRPGTIDYGRDYEFKITSLISLRCVELKNIQHMWLAANVDDCGAFDDIVLFIEIEGRESITYLIQLKHQTDVKNIGVGEFKSKRDFVLKKYHNTIRDIQNSRNNSEMINHVKDNLDKIAFIIYTNRGTIADEFLIKVHKNSDIDVKWMFSQLINTNGNIFKFDYKKLGMTIENDIKYLTEENLFLFTNQIHVNEVDVEIEKVVEKIIRPLKLPKNILSDVIKKYTSVITQWSKGELGGHYLLTKDAINNILFELFLTTYMKKLEYEVTDPLLDRENGIWNTIVENYPLLVIEWDEIVVHFLNNYINKGIKLYSENEKNINMWKRHTNDIKKSILRNAGRSKKIRPFDAYEYLWKNGHLPLILQVNSVGEFESVLQIIKRLECKMKVIILLEKLPSSQNLNSVSSLKDLKSEHKIKILEKEVKFQGRISVKLLNILSEELQQFVSIRNVIYILLDKFNVGNTYEPLPEIFINRTFKKVWIMPTVFNHIMDEIFVIEYSSSADLEVFRKKYKLKFENLNLSLWRNSSYLDKHKIFITTVIEKGKFEHVNRTVHFLVLHSNDSLEWIGSIGNLSELAMYRKKLNFDITKVEQVLANFQRNKLSTTLISDNPGMGKSVLLDYIALHAPTNSWIIKINLYDYVSFYKTENFEDLYTSPHKYLMHFAYKILTKQGCNDILTKSIFADYLNSKRVLLLLDGFDEIPVRFHSIVKKMIKAIHEANYCIYVTTRPLLKQGLEDLLNTLSISINPFSKIDKITYLTDHFHKTIDVLTPKNEKLTKIFVDKLLDSAKQNLQKQDEEFTGIPLQIKLLAEVFTDSFKQFLQTNQFINENFDLLYLYKKFIEQKTEIVCDRYGNSFDDVQHNYKILRSMYALKVLFEKKDLEDLNIDERLKTVTEFLPNTLQLIQKDGIVIVEDEDNVTFVHRTFGEYLAAEWLSENINTKYKETMRILARKAFDSNYTVVRNILDRLLAKNCPLHTAVINREVNVIKEALLKDLTIFSSVDNGNRSLLHLIAAWGIYHPHEPVSKNYNEVDDKHRDIIFEFYDDVVKDNAMVDIFKLIPNQDFTCTKDGIFNYTPLDYSILSGSLRIAEAICVKLKNLDNWISITNFNLHYINYYAEQCTYDSLRSWAYKHYVTTKLKSLHLENSLQDNNTCLPLYAALIGDQIDKIQNLLESYDIDVNIKDASGKTSLHWAVIKGYTFVVQTLCSKDNVDIDGTDNYGMSALHYAVLACTNNQEEIISQLIKKKPNFNILDHTGKTALHHTVLYDQENCLKLFLDSEFNLNILELKNDEEETLLISAAKVGNTVLVDLLLSYGADIEARDKEQHTALHWAANNGHVDTVDLLLFKGADTKANSYYRRTPLGLATFLGRKDVVELFLAKTNVNINDKEDRSLFTLLHYAAWKGHIELVDLFLSIGADLHVVDKYGGTALMYATRYSHKNVIELLISKGASIDIRDNDDWTPLLAAADTGDVDITELLILNGANIEAMNQKGKTPLAVAAYGGDTEIMELLLTKQANIEARDVRDMTSLHWAAKKGKVEAVEFLLENGANLEAKAQDGKTPLIFAARKNHIGVINALLSVGVNIDAYDNEHKTSICWAAIKGCVDVVELLLAAGANYEMRDTENLTPLERAQKNGHTAIASLFLSTLTKKQHVVSSDNDGVNQCM